MRHDPLEVMATYEVAGEAAAAELERQLARLAAGTGARLVRVQAWRPVRPSSIWRWLKTPMARFMAAPTSHHNPEDIR